MYRHALLIVLFLSFILCAWSQQEPPVQCGQKTVTDKLLRDNPLLRQYHDKVEKQLQNYHIAVRKGQAKSMRTTATVTLPVVVHVIHNNSLENISNTQILTGIQHLNEAFANTGYYDPSNGVNTQIQFCLAQRDPNGNATNGITRDVSPYTVMGGADYYTDDQHVKNINRWNPSCYINIWLVRSIPGSVAGYAYLPSAHGTSLDGIVMEAFYFGSSESKSVVTIHEMGHYLGLYHTFEGSCKNDDCTKDGDKVCDTPPDQSTASANCSVGMNSCSTDMLSGFSTDVSDLIEDYMDYGNFDCMKVFTQGQADRMNWHIQNVRSSLMNCKSCLTPCPTPVTANFTNPPATLPAGSSINFVNGSVNATGYQWYVNNTQFSTTASPTYTFTNPGTYTIKLVALSGNPLCNNGEKEVTITVTCPAKAAYTPSAVNVLPNTTVSFTNNSTGATGFSWLVNDVQQATTSNFSYTFTTGGLYTVKLIAGSGACKDSVMRIIRVKDVCHEYSFIKTLGGAGKDIAYDVCTTTDGGYLMAGSTTSFGATGSDGYLVKLDNQGNVLWNQRYGGTGDDQFNKVIQTADGGYLAIGQSKSLGIANFAGWVQKIQANGTIMWTRAIYEGAASFVASGVTITADGGYAIAGTSSASATVTYPVVVKLSATGTFLWSKAFSTSSKEAATDIIDDNGALIVAGYTGAGASYSDAFLMKLDATGNITWTKKYDIGLQDNLSGNQLYKQDGGYLFTAPSTDGPWTPNSQKTFVVKTDGLGNVIIIHYPDYGYRNGANTAVTAPSLDGGYFVGYTGFTDRDLYISHSNASWKPVWGKAFLIPGSQLNYALRPTGDGGVISVGYTDNGGNLDLFVVKTDLRGNTGGCTAQDGTAVLVNTTNAVNNHTFSLVRNFTIGTPPAPTLTTTSGTLAATVLCNASTTCAEPDSCTRRSSFRKSYGTPQAERGQSIEPLFDGGYIVAGSATAKGRSDLDALLVKLNGQGDTVWTKRFGGQGEDVFTKAKQVSDGGIIAIGHSRSYGNAAGDMFIIKTDDQGNFLWRSSYESNAPNGIRVYDLVNDASGTVYIVGDYNAGPGVSDLLVVGIQIFNGSPYIAYTYDNAGLEDHGTGITEYEDTLVVTGYTRSGTANDAVLLKLRKWNGAVYASYRYDRLQGNDAFHQLYRVGTDFLISTSYATDLAGNGFKHGITRLDRHGNVLKSWLNNTLTTHNGPHSLFPSLDGGFVTAESENNGNSNAHLYKFDAAGNMQAGKVYSQPGDEQMYQVLQNDDGSYIMAGTSGSSGVGSANSDVFVIKTDIAGNTLGCSIDSSLAALVASPVTAQPITWTVTFSPGIFDNGLRTESNTASLVTNSLCIYQPCDTIIPPLAPDTCDRTFVKKFADPDTTANFHTLLETKDGFLLAAGNIAPGKATPQPLIVKFTKDGDIVWQKTLTTVDMSILTNAIHTSDDHYLFIARQAGSSATGSVLLKTDPSGNMVWKKVLTVAANTFMATTLVEGNDGAYYIGGQSLVASLSLVQVTLTKVNPDGSMAWSKRYNSPANTSLLTTEVADETSSIMVTGVYDYLPNNTDDGFFVLRVNKTTGSAMGAKNNSFGASVAAPQLVQFVNTQYLITVQHTTPTEVASILTMDVNMNITNKQTFGRAGGANYLRTAVNKQGEVYGTYLYGGGIGLLKTNNLLQPVWARKHNLLPSAALPPFVVGAGNNLYLFNSGIMKLNNAAPFLARFNAMGQLFDCASDTIQPALVQANLNTTNITLTAVDVPFLADNNNPVTNTSPQLLMTEQSCAGSNACDTLAINGKDTVCLPTGKIQKYSSVRSTGCSSAVIWTIDPAYADIIHTTDSTIELQFKRTDSVTLYARINTGCKLLYDSLRIYIYQSPNKIDLGPDLAMCQVSTWALHAGPGFKSYRWQDGSADSVFTAYNTGTYFVEAYDYCGNAFRDTVVISQAPPVAFDLGPDTLICNHDTLTLSAPAGFTNYRWSANYRINSIYGQAIKIYTDVDTIYSVTAELSPGCIVTDTIRIALKKAPSINLGKDTSFCEHATIQLDAGSGFKSYVWNTTATTQQVSVAAAGTYLVDAEYHNGCHARDTLVVQTIYKLPVVDLGKDTILCDDATMTFKAGNGFIKYKWQDASVNPTFTAVQPGKYWVEVEDAHRCVNADTVLITGIKALPTDFLQDTIQVCEGLRRTITPVRSYENYLWYNQTTTASIELTSPGRFWLQVTDYSGCVGYDTVEVFEKECIRAVYFPNAFTPNNDGSNDVFRPAVSGMPERYRLIIYSRWGEKVFDTTIPGLGWNGQWKGQLMDTGSFIWVCSYKFAGRAEKTEKGHVTLVR